MDSTREFEIALDSVLNEFSDSVPYLDIDRLLQERAQDMREHAYAEGEVDAITAEDIDGCDG